jgi:hypothetical protein
MTSLFLRPKDVGHEKTAGEVNLPEDPNQWPKELLQEVYKQVPFISEFQPRIEMTKVDGERGYALGHIEVSNKTELSAPSPENQAAVDVKMARIPIVVANRKLKPLDLLIPPGEKPTIVPLTEGRLRAALFRPEAFDVTSRSPGDMSMIGQLYPPYRQNFGMGGAGATTGAGGMGKSAEATEKTAEWKQTQYSMDELLALGGWSGKGGQWATREYGERTKTAGSMEAAHAVRGARLTPLSERQNRRREEEEEKKGSLLAAILPTLNDADFAKFASAYSDPEVRAAVLHNPAAQNAVRTLAQFEPGSVKTASAGMLNAIVPSVVQLCRVADGYLVKSAHSQTWRKRVEHLDRGEAVEVFGPKIVLAADTTGSATIAEDTLPDEAMDIEQKEPSSVISEFGMYRCKNLEGGEIAGYVFPQLLDRNGDLKPQMLFTNGTSSALQGEIAGKLIEDEMQEDVHLMEGGHPDGFGTFYKAGEEGPVAMMPMQVDMPISMEGNVCYMATDPITGAKFQIEMSPGLEKPTMLDDKCLIPTDFTWLSLGSSDAVALASNSAEYTKEAQASLPLFTVEIRGSGTNCFSIDGLAVSKLASQDRHFLNVDDAMFLLSALGASPRYAGVKLAAASTGYAPVPIRVKHFIKTAADSYRETVKSASERLAKLPNLKRDLFKEAASIPDPNTVDAVLSLGFINPENLSTFVSHLPAIDAAQKNMCELLLAARIGSLETLSQGSLEKSIRATEDVIEGLKTLAFGQ